MMYQKPQSFIYAALGRVIHFEVSTRGVDIFVQKPEIEHGFNFPC